MTIVAEKQLDSRVVKIKLMNVPAGVSQHIKVDAALNGMVQLTVPNGCTPGGALFRFDRFADTLIVSYGENGIGLRNTRLTLVVPKTFTGFLDNDRGL